MLTERKLTERELDHREVVLKNLLKNKSNLVKKYGKDAEKVMYGIATKKAKKKIEQMNLDTIKELVRTQLEASPTSTTTDIDANKSYSGGADYGSEVSANSAENSIEQGETQPLHYSLEEGHGLDQGDIDVLKNLITQLKDGGDLRLDVAGRKSFIRVLNFIIKSNILQDKTKDLSKGKVDEIGVGVVQDPAIYEAFLTIIGILGAGAGAAKTAEYLSNNADKVIDWVADNAPKYLDKVKDYISKKVKLTENTLNEFLKGALKDRNQVLFDKLVPGMGASEFAEGEMIRALNRLVYRWYNDGDKFFEGYGTETAGPAHSFLVNSDQINRGEQRKLEALFDAVVGTYDDKTYEDMLDKVADLVMSYVEGIPEDQYQELGREMFDFEPEYEEEDYDEEDDFYDEYDEEEEDYYMNEEKEDIGKILKAQKIIKKVLKDEGGAAGLKPIVAALKGLKIGKDELIKILKKTVGVVKHQHGDYIIKPIEEITLSEKIDALVREKLTKKSDVGDFVDDFQKSDAKQFKGKSDKKKKEMAVAAYLAKQNEK